MAARRGKRQAQRRSGSGLPGWAWLSIGLLIGALAFGWMFLREKWQLPASLLPQPNPNAQAPRESDPPLVPEAPEKPRPKYDFYTLLPEKEVVIPDAELDAQARAEAEATAPATDSAATAAIDKPNATPAVAATTPAESTARYLIQAGAFRGQNEAEALKAQIALSGEIARVETAEINGNTVYRVRMGPYPTASGLAAAKQALANHGITAQAIRVK
jgi:cell division protein FtsN